ncbi:hypothetical protein DH2020_041979 [Rehmannia glutinosa]|uniref:Uncharacterized protein n=1 Tax=Rehmannia glutinosa TaxID=99300 RepID=A0ABR0UPC6_REHGL
MPSNGSVMSSAVVIKVNLIGFYFGCLLTGRNRVLKIRYSMEKRQLDFNAPLLSARRYSSPTNSSELVKRKVFEKRPPSKQQSPPLNKSEWEPEAVTKPAAVPFHWEHTPGRPKTGVETPNVGRISDAIWRSSGEIPKLPPGRLSGPSRYSSGEQNIYRPQIEAFSFSDHASLLEKLNDSLKCKDESESESEDDAYSDALDSLSLTESWSLNYSVSGISGYHSSGVKPSGTFCVDKQTREFMMNRFLPAAKAVVIETPQYVVKKPTVLNEQPKEMKKVVSGELRLLKQYGADALPYQSRYIDNWESGDEEPESKVPVKKSGKTWGILPRFCVKNSLCLLNPIPGLKSKTRTPTTPLIGEVKRLRRNALSGPLDKNACQVPHKKKFHSGLLSRDLPRIEDKLTNDSYQFLNSRDSPKSGLSSLRRYRSGSISPYRNESPKSAFREGAGFLGVPKEVENFNANKIASSRKLFKALQDVSRTQINERGSSGLTSDVMEKTVYVDSINKKADALGDFCGERSKVFADSWQMEEKYAVKSDQHIPSPKFADEVKDSKPNRSLDQESKTLERNEMPSDVKFGIKEEEKSELENGRESDSTMKSPLPPPLPKSPSESWLWRTLPSISLGNPFAHSRRNSQLNSKKGSATDAKWETIVKTSNLRHDHVRYSEELITHASHRQRKS